MTPKVAILRGFEVWVDGERVGGIRATVPSSEIPDEARNGTICQLDNWLDGQCFTVINFWCDGN